MKARTEAESGTSLRVLSKSSHFVSKSIRMDGRNEASVKRVRVPKESTKESGKELRFGVPRL